MRHWRTQHTYTEKRLHIKHTESNTHVERHKTHKHTRTHFGRRTLKRVARFSQNKQWKISKIACSTCEFDISLFFWMLSKRVSQGVTKMFCDEGVCVFVFAREDVCWKKILKLRRLRQNKRESRYTIPQTKPWDEVACKREEAELLSFRQKNVRPPRTRTPSLRLTGQRSLPLHYNANGSARMKVFFYILSHLILACDAYSFTHYRSINYSTLSFD